MYFDSSINRSAEALSCKYAEWLASDSHLPLEEYLMPEVVSTFPGGSRGMVNRAGERVREGTTTDLDVAVIDTWRAAHRPVLNTFQAILRTRTRGTGIIVAQRHKRKLTIYDKLFRLPRMQLSRMDDVAGCRLIFPSISALRKFREKLHHARFEHRLRNEVEKYDYIQHPKSTGYRGIHDVYEYDVNSDHGKPYKGLLIELQYRTIYQHAWATCVEVVGFITESQPKFQQGDDRYEKILAIASEVIARAHESSKSCFPDLSDKEVVKQFSALDNELKFLRMLRNLNAASNEVTAKKNIILMFSDSEKLEIRSYRDATDAIKALFELEKAATGKDIVLVRADSSENVRIAFRNYFSDATEFIKFVETGCEKLLGLKVTSANATKKTRKRRRGKRGGRRTKA
jgi:putative GTP pyrophosphokinase